VEIGKTIIYLGLILVVIGIVLSFSGAIPWIKNIGRLPGDFVIKKENMTFYFPLATSLLVSLFLTLLVFFYRKLFR